MNERIKLTSFSISRRNDERILRAFTICAGDCFQSLLCIDDLNDSALPFKAVDRFAHFSGGEFFDRALKFGLSLADDLAKFDGRHSVLLKLFEGRASFNRLMLTAISNE